MIDLIVQGAGGDTALRFAPKQLVIAGWTGRDAAALNAHIAELEALGIARPKIVPIFYRAAASLLTTAPLIQTVGRDASGEVEAVLWKQNGTLYVGVGSDHTDRKLEASGITLSKQLCAKPVSAVVWPWAEVADHWDRVTLRSRLPSSGALYQQGVAAALRRPDELLALYEAHAGALPDGGVLFCGTLAVQGEIRFSPDMELALIDPVLGRTLTHRYTVDSLPIVEE